MLLIASETRCGGVDAPLLPSGGRGHRLRRQARGVDGIKLHELVHVQIAMLRRLDKGARRRRVHRQVDGVLRVHFVEAVAVIGHRT